MEGNVWIFDCYFKGCVELWGRDKRLVTTSPAFPPCFYMHPYAHRDMIEALENADIRELAIDRRVNRGDLRFYINAANKELKIEVW